jgi:E3 ubiquitin-protein ligase UHRF1
MKRRIRKGDRGNVKWGNGMANAGILRKCTIVKDTHRGPIPGIEVGQTWKFRSGMSEDGVHRPLVGGVAGSVAKVGCVSVVMAGGYAEDKDNGDSFIYSGSGGRDLATKNERTAKFQSFDQQLAKFNLSLAMTCDAPVNVNGAKAKNWRQSKGIRVIRSHKLKKNQAKYAPELGNRYDGVYKIVEYYIDTITHDHKVYKFVFRRDDPSPAPWTKAGKKRIEELGLEMVVPENYETLQSSMDECRVLGVFDNVIDALPTNRLKRKYGQVDDPSAKPYTSDKYSVIIYTGIISRIDKNFYTSFTEDSSMDVGPWSIPLQLDQLITADREAGNSLLWRTTFEKPIKNYRGFITTVQQELMCPICMEFVEEPVTNPCGHNACMSCMRVSVEGFGAKCPKCRQGLVEIPEDFEELLPKVRLGANADAVREEDEVREKERKRLWKRSVEVNENLINVIRFWNTEYSNRTVPKLPQAH